MPPELRTLALATLCLVSTGCGIADLRSTALLSEITPESETRGRELLQEAQRIHGAGRWASASRVTWTLRDLWSSSFLRWFTPLPSNDERLRVSFVPGESALRVELLGGEKSGLVLGVDPDGKAFQVDAEGARSARGGQTALYLESLGVYLGLPFRQGTTVADAGPADLGGRSHQRVFVTDGAAEPHGEADQYVYWVDDETRRITCIEFTYRELLRSYRGALLLDDFREVQGVLTPRRVRVADEPSSTAAIHELIIEDMTLE